MTENDTALLAGPPSALGEADFVACYGALYEHSPWVAQRTWRQGLNRSHDTLGGLAQALAATLAAASPKEQLDLINAHPDLAGKTAVCGELTDDSTNEQAGAGLEQCSAEEFARFERLNAQYKARFGFPFIMAVRGSNRHQILAAFDARVGNSVADERAEALHQINRIARLRLELHVQSERETDVGSDQ